MIHTIPYTPRGAFKEFHNQTKRWSCLVAHRRAGKTVAAALAAEMIGFAIVFVTRFPRSQVHGHAADGVRGDFDVGLVGVFHNVM